MPVDCDDNSALGRRWSYYRRVRKSRGHSDPRQNGSRASDRFCRLDCFGDVLSMRSLRDFLGLIDRSCRES